MKKITIDEANKLAKKLGELYVGYSDESSRDLAAVFFLKGYNYAVDQVNSPSFGKMTAVQYFPSFCSGFEPNIVKFTNSRELLNVDWVRNFENDDKFYRFSLSRDTNNPPQHLLMAEYNVGYKHYVVAIIRDNDISGLSDLPEWRKRNYTRKEK